METQNSIYYPFTAVVGQDEAKLALLLNAIDPKIGGVLLRGEKGSAKTTLARGLASLLSLDAPFVELPLGATEDRLVGSLDISAALDESKRKFQPGLLAQADGGVLYVDEINLLPDHLVDMLLDAAASGIHRVERDSFSHQHKSRFILIGSMNPEEGELRPQLLDRFGLCVDVRASNEISERVEAVSRRLDFDANPEQFYNFWKSNEDDLREKITLTTPVPITPKVIQAASKVCVSFAVEGLRADLVLCRSAAALAAWDGKAAIEHSDLAQVIELVLSHRKRQSPLDDIGLDDQQLSAAIDNLMSSDFDEEKTDQADPNGDGKDIESNEIPSDQNNLDNPPGESERFVASIGLKKQLDIDTTSRSKNIDKNSAAFGKATNFESNRGRIKGSQPFIPGGKLAIQPTIQAGLARKAFEQQKDSQAWRRPLRFEKKDLMQAKFESKSANLVILVVDSSGSMGTIERIEAIKGAIFSLLLDSYTNRDRLAMISFGDKEAKVVLKPTGSIEIAKARLANLATGGTTPLAQGIRKSLEICKDGLSKKYQPFIVVISDAKATWSANGLDPMQEALLAGEEVRRCKIPCSVIDTEQSSFKLAMASKLATSMGASYIHLDEVKSESIASIIRDATDFR